ncbi:MAG: 16S rRNA (guanine(966)-N(2))-methyltransferase RsmD [Neisseriaceae bacterium]|nr:16S rRNA (guanine(966)-N(2))-methyltransferase RsmD [Neisseriaceae bacterium]
MTNTRNQVRLIGGLYRRRLLEFPSVEGLRPTPDRVKETLFNWLGQNLAGQCCLDLFSGSGALGFEAWSRGAQQVVCVEANPKVVRSLEKNKANLSAKDITILKMDAFDYLNSGSTKFDVIFLDPPFVLMSPVFIVRLLSACVERLSFAGLIYLESSLLLDPNEVADFVQLKSGKAGLVKFSLWQRRVE